MTKFAGNFMFWLVNILMFLLGGKSSGFLGGTSSCFLGEHPRCLGENPHFWGEHPRFWLKILFLGVNILILSKC